tara:strand:+ start:4210 stop:4440 length:231 start_codon:yes stop_codon:yes gene_type:complete
MANSQANPTFSLKIPNVLDHINYWLRLVLQRAGELAQLLDASAGIVQSYTPSEMIACSSATQGISPHARLPPSGKI